MSLITVSVHPRFSDWLCLRLKATERDFISLFLFLFIAVRCDMENRSSSSYAVSCDWHESGSLFISLGFDQYTGVLAKLPPLLMAHRESEGEKSRPQSEMHRNTLSKMICLHW